MKIIDPVTPPVPPAPGTTSAAWSQAHARVFRPVPPAQLAAEPVDLLVIGGGITGAGIARDAAMRGLSVALVEARDLGYGTSSRSSRLVHGGLRYLEHGQVRLVREALRERRTLLSIAPHLVRPLQFVFPVHAGDRLSPLTLSLGVLAYEALAGFRNLGRTRSLGKRGVLELEPMLREKGLRGGVTYEDAQCDDARLVIGTARAAQLHGARIATRAPVRALLIEEGRVAGAEVEDADAGGTSTVRARLVVNAAGPWADAIRALEVPGEPRVLRLTRGTHVLLPRERIGHRHAIAFLSPIDGRVMFALPWGDFSYIGTTDVDHDGPPDDLAVRRADVVYLLRSLNARFPGAHLTEDDVRSSWCGLRPLVHDVDAHRESSVPREHALLEGRHGLLTIVGGKLTTYRAMAAEVVDRVARVLGRKLPAAATATEPLPGGEAADLEPFRARGAALGLPAAVIDHLLRQYGTECAGIYNLGLANRGLLDRVHPTHPALAAEVVHAARRELARSLEDVMVRRLHLFYETRDHGARAAQRVAELLGKELGWDAARTAAEVASYVRFIAAEQRWR